VELHQRHHRATTRGQRLLLRFFNSSALVLSNRNLVKRAVPRPPGTVPGGLAGMAELRTSAFPARRPGGGRGRSKARLSFPLSEES
jgi:hypothetical protein